MPRPIRHGQFGSAGAGTASHITGEYFAAFAGIKLVHIPYKGTGPALTDLLGGHIPMAFAPIPASTPMSRRQAARPRGDQPERSGLLPDVPTIAESGLPGFDASLYYGLVAPAVRRNRSSTSSTRPARRAGLRRGEEAVGNDGTDITPGSPEDYADRIDKDEKKWAQLVKASGVEPE